MRVDLCEGKISREPLNSNGLNNTWASAGLPQSIWLKISIPRLTPCMKCCRSTTRLEDGQRMAYRYNHG
jgi:hypothetical protein